MALPMPKWLNDTLRPEAWRPHTSSASRSRTAAPRGERGGKRQAGDPAADDQDIRIHKRRLTDQAERCTLLNIIRNEVCAQCAGAP
jgi:hypothetical protein